MRLELHNVSKRYGQHWALREVSCEFAPGRVHGIVGVNGSGKSTMMKVIAGAERATEGELLFDGTRRVPRTVGHADRLGIGLVPQELPVVPRLSVAENVLLGRLRSRYGILQPGKVREQAAAVLAELGVDADLSQPVGELTLAHRQLVVIARTLVRQARVLLLDEPTSSLGAAEVATLRTIIRDQASQGRTVILVSQRLDDIFAAADEVHVLRGGRLLVSGPLADIGADRTISLMLYGQDHAPSAAGSHGHRTTALLPGASDDTDRAALRLDRFPVPAADTTVTLSVRPGDVVGLAGLPGSGARELLLGLFGSPRTRTASITLDGAQHRIGAPAVNVAHGIAYVTGDRQAQGVVPDASVTTNIALAASRRLGAGPARLHQVNERARAQIEALDIRPGDPDAPMRTLSGGNQQKALFARWLLTEPRLWLLDDATRGVDVAARHDIHHALRTNVDTGASAALVVSSDVLELFDVCDRVVVFRAGQIVADQRTADLDPAQVEALTVGVPVNSTDPASSHGPGPGGPATDGTTAHGGTAARVAHA